MKDESLAVINARHAEYSVTHNECIYTDKLTSYQHLVYVEHCTNTQRWYVMKRPLLSKEPARIVTYAFFPIKLYQPKEDEIPEIVIDYPAPTLEQLEPILRQHPFGTCTAGELRVILMDCACPRYTTTLVRLPESQTICWSNRNIVDVLEQLREARYPVGSPAVSQHEDSIAKANDTEHNNATIEAGLSDPFEILDDEVIL